MKTMATILGYKTLDKIYEGSQTVVYRAHRERDCQPVILKFLRSDYPTFAEITELKYEYEIARNLNLEGIVKPYGFENHNGNSVGLVLEDFGGESLAHFMEDRKFSIEEFFKIAIQIAEIIGELHKNQIIHKDIKPKNIIINQQTQQVKITDFSIASRLEREHQTISNPNLLQGTLAYMSPEQTGRMNRAIDYRTDFYSLGVTFYEMLTGQLPFTTTDPLELIHCHIAKQPVPPHQLNPEIPQAVSDTVMKLLAKIAEERYQSALGIKADLEICYNRLQTNGQIINFTPGQHDKSGQFIIPQTLYGREAEVGKLMAAFDRVSAGNKEMILVSGYSGIGKTSVVNEVHKPIVRQRGYFIEGKFDQFKRNIPYSAVVSAFQDLIRQILTESPENIEIWKQKLLYALGSNGQVIIDVIPEVELIVGKQSDVPELGATESQNRFNRVFQEFIQVFAKQKHPLVMFLDDLQWADSASLKLIQLLMSDRDSEYLLLIGAYRDNEVDATHPLMLALEDIQKIGGIINNITLQNLEMANVSQLIADTVRDDIDKVKLLAEILFHKTQGNPFFITQLLRSLYEDGLLTFDYSVGCWQWDIAEIQTCAIQDCNVIDLIARNIQKLSKETQKCLKLAACIGNQFYLDVLAIVNEKSPSETAVDLWEALQAGLIIPLSDTYKMPMVIAESSSLIGENDELSSINTRQSTQKINYRFLHDRVQQAAYSLIPEEEKKATHLKLGRLLIESIEPDEIEEHIFDIVNQLNIGIEFITHQEEKDELVRFNLIAGRKAKQATAYEPAVQYLNVALGMLEPESWKNQYDLTLKLYLEAAEAEYLNTNFSQSATLAQVILQQATNLLDRVKVYELQIQFCIAQNQMFEAIDRGLQVLNQLGISLSEAPTDGHGWVELPQLEELENIPEMTDPYQLAAMRILMNIAPPAIVANPKILLPVILTMLNLCIEHGYSGRAAYAYVIYGVILCGAKGDVENGYHSGLVALKLLDRFQAWELKSKVYSPFNGFIRHWKEHISETLAPLVEGIQSGLETGDLEYAGYCALEYCDHIFWLGERLNLVEKRQNLYIDLMNKNFQKFSQKYINIGRQLIVLIQNSNEKLDLNNIDLDELIGMQDLHDTNNGMSLFAAYLTKGVFLYFYKNYHKALDEVSLATEYAASAIGMMSVSVHNFYYSLILLAHYPKVTLSEQQQYLKQLEKNQEKMQQWAYHAPENFQHKYELVEAEKARVLGQLVEAMELYDRAIAGAAEQGYIQEEALANELAAEFYFSLGRHKVAQSYLMDAYYRYIDWGATAKVKDLESTYPNLFYRPPSRETLGINVHSTTTSTTGLASSGALDFATVMKASQALADEIVLGNLLDKLLKIVMESAGAQTSCFILDKEGKLAIEATGNVEQDEILLWSSQSVETCENLPLSLINYISRIHETVVLNDATREGRFTTDPYIVKTQPKSILCTPIVNQGQLIGILYLENNLTTGAFTAHRLEVLKILSSQAAISLKNALLYTNLETTTEKLKVANEQLEEYSHTLEEKVEERTVELKDKNEHLQQALGELQRTQTQLIQTEKMSSLGQLVAGVAHEINNPVNFIYGNLTHASEDLQDLLELIDLYEETYPNSTPPIKAHIEAIELEFLKDDFPKILKSMQVGADRIRQIVLSLRSFSRLDEAEMKEVDIHDGIESTLLILQHRLKEKTGQSGIEAIKKYGQLPQVECYAGQLNQVFMNILSNAIDALEMRMSQKPSVMSRSETSSNSRLPINHHQSPTILIRTEVRDPDRVAIRIADNGCGMTESVRSKLFDPFFTTKPVGSGTGLGLSISYQIVVEKHGGQLYCISEFGQGTEFIIEIPVKPRKR